MTSADPPAELGIDACWRLLREADVGRLALVVDDHPEIFPVTFAVDSGTVLFRTGAGTKLVALADSPVVAFEVDGYDLATQVVWSVVVKGRAQVVRGASALLETTDVAVHPWHASVKNHFVRLEADEVSGRCFRRSDPAYWVGGTGGGPRTSPE
jgi:nitroimidazol reductase NimA-like FMN-containing flavoprotein (pyridoxamine 5'-phosphate oxidase superfamily)